MKMPFSAIERVLDLVKMPDLHNSFGTLAVPEEVAKKAIRLLVDLPPDIPDPRIVPWPHPLVPLVMTFESVSVEVGENVTAIRGALPVADGIGGCWVAILGKERADALVAKHVGTAV